MLRLSRPLLLAGAAARCCVTSPRSVVTNTATISLLRCNSKTSYFRGFASIAGVDVIELEMPALSPTMERGNIAQWTKKIGDEVKGGEVVAEVETDKATVAFESVEEGYIAAILIPDGAQDVEVGTLVALMVEDEEDLEAVKKAVADGALDTGSRVAPPVQEKPATVPSQATSAPAHVENGDSKEYAGKFSPAVALLLANNRLDSTTIVGTGRKGMLLKGDILAAIKSGTAKTLSSESTPAAPAPSATPTSSPPASQGAPGRRRNRSFIDIPSTNMRKIIANRLGESKRTIPHSYATAECNMAPLLAFRKSLAQLDASTKPPSVNDFVIRASALACNDVPVVNSTYDAKTDSVNICDTVDVSIAVAVDAGLITPIIPKADTLRLNGISAKVRELAGKAKNGTLSPEEFVGGSFTISNLGMFGVSEFSAVINLPQTSILAVGGSINKTIAGEEEGELISVPFMKVTLSHDQRAVDSGEAAEWLSRFKTYIESPMAML